MADPLRGGHADESLAPGLRPFLELERRQMTPPNEVEVAYISVSPRAQPAPQGPTASSLCDNTHPLGVRQPDHPLLLDRPTASSQKVGAWPGMSALRAAKDVSGRCATYRSIQATWVITEPSSPSA
jgi:hypothetical protein